MSESDENLARLKRKLERESAARTAAENLLEVRSAELYEITEQLREEALQVKHLSTAIDVSADGVAITNKDKRIEIRNFLGEKVVRTVDALEGCTAKRSADVKDEISVEGNDIDSVSRTCALVQQICAVKRKDIRKFLDGIYVSFKGNVIVD